MRFNFIVEVEVERIEGKFASRDELSDQIIGALEDADPGDLEGDNGGQYNIISWSVAQGIT
jgi:hypothetical protein